MVYYGLPLSILDACGGYIDQANGTLQSPSFPELYPPNKNCVWQIAAPEQYRITLNFTHFDLEGNNVSRSVLNKDVQIVCMLFYQNDNMVFNML